LFTKSELVTIHDAAGEVLDVRPERVPTSKKPTISVKIQDGPVLTDNVG